MEERKDGGGAGALLVGQADLEVVEVGALELLLELVEGMLDLVLEAVIIIIVVVLDPVAVAVGLMRMRHGQGGGGADELRKRVGDLRAQGRKGERDGSRSVDRVSAQYVCLFSKVCTSSVAVINKWAGIYSRLESKSGCGRDGCGGLDG